MADAPSELAGARDRIQPLLMELPDYHWPHVRSLAIGLWERARIFLTRVGGIILSLMIVLWFLFINMLVDIVYAAIDPRIKQG